eukprot:Gb_00115 [translate_table: standard]
MPALILLPTNVLGFSTNLFTCPVSSSSTTTPYLEGSSTLVTITEASAPCDLWNSIISFKGNSQITSLFNTKIGCPEPSTSLDLAKAKGPAVPKGSVSREHVILIPCSASNSLKNFSILSG